MSVRINEEIKLFDEDLKLFDENSWDFLNVDHTQENYEYFNDIRDIHVLVPPPLYRLSPRRFH